MYSINDIYTEKGHITWLQESGEITIFTNK